MKKIEIEVPDYIANLSEMEKKKLTNTFLALSIKERINKLTEESKAAKEKLNKYENQFNYSLDDLEKKGLNNNSNLEKHEKYMDWVFWQKVYEKSQKEIEKYQIFLRDEINEQS
ncbi:MAG: hypothetical protein ACOCUI_01690 [bacterium]